MSSSSAGTLPKAFAWIMGDVEYKFLGTLRRCEYTILLRFENSADFQTAMQFVEPLLSRDRLSKSLLPADTTTKDS